MGTDAENWLQETMPYKSFFKNSFKHFKNMCMVFRGEGGGQGGIAQPRERERGIRPPPPPKFDLPFEPEKAQNILKNIVYILNEFVPSHRIFLTSSMFIPVYDLSLQCQLDLF